MVVQYVLLCFFPASLLAACLAFLYSYLVAHYACPVPVCFFWYVSCLWVLFYLHGFTHNLPIIDVIWLLSCFLHAPWFILSSIPGHPLYSYFSRIYCLFWCWHAIVPAIFLLGTSLLCNNFHTFCFYALRLSIPATCSFICIHCIYVPSSSLHTVRSARMCSSVPLLEPGPPRFFGGMKNNE